MSRDTCADCERMHQAMVALAEQANVLRDQRDAARRLLCEMKADERIAKAKWNGISMRYTWQDIAREYQFHDLLPRK